MTSAITHTAALKSTDVMEAFTDLLRRALAQKNDTDETTEARLLAGVILDEITTPYGLAVVLAEDLGKKLAERDARRALERAHDIDERVRDMPTPVLEVALAANENAWPEIVA